MKLVLANIDYRQHCTDEGDQLQEGLREAGWQLAGRGYEITLQDCEEILDVYRPHTIFVQDRRDWDPRSPGAYRKDVGFQNLGALGRAKDVFKIAVLKDAGSVPEFHREFVEEMDADLVLVYYEEATVRALNPWLGERRLVRTYHSVDRNECLSPQHWIEEEPKIRRKRGVVSGALGPHVYPLRTRVWQQAEALGLDRIYHPGYGNRGTSTPHYLRRIAGYKVHLATASIYGFALRKIIESVAQGVTPITNLPNTDPLPEIEGALWKIPSDASVAELVHVIDEVEKTWTQSERFEWASRAINFYDFREIGRRLDRLIEEARCTVSLS